MVTTQDSHQLLIPMGFWIIILVYNNVPTEVNQSPSVRYTLKMKISDAKRSTLM